MARAVIFGLAMFVLLTGATVEALDIATGRHIERTADECLASRGSCQWRVELGDQLGGFHRSFAFFPGLLVYPVAPVAAFAAWHRSYVGARRRTWRLLALACVLVLARFMWLGVYTAVTH